MYGLDPVLISFSQLNY